MLQLIQCHISNLINKFYLLEDVYVLNFTFYLASLYGVHIRPIENSSETMFQWTRVWTLAYLSCVMAIDWDCDTMNPLDSVDEEAPQVVAMPFQIRTDRSVYNYGDNVTGA